MLKKIVQLFDLNKEDEIFIDEVIIIMVQTIKYADMFKRIEQAGIDYEVITNLK